MKKRQLNQLKIPKSKLEGKFIIPISNFGKRFIRGRFCARGSWQLLALLAYSNVSEIKFFLICFFMTKIGPLQNKIIFFGY